MSIETHKYFLGKTRAILMAETQSERWVSWIRLALGIIGLISGLICYLMGSIALKTFVLQVVALAVMFVYSSYFLLRSQSRLLLHDTSAFVFAFFDVAVISVIVWSYALDAYLLPLDHGTFLGAYCIVISFTALHNRIGLSVFSGVLSALAYGALYFEEYHASTGVAVGVPATYLIHMLVLLGVAFVSGIVTRNNLLTIQKVISSEIRYKNLVHRLPEMLFTLDAGGRFLWVNMASHAILGLPAKLLRGRTFREFLEQPDLFKFDRAGTKGTFEIRDYEKKLKFVDCNIQPAREAGSDVAWEGIMTDVTERELAISQREEMSNRLYQFEKMESLGTLASGMAHDFNNIMQIIGDITDLTTKETKETETVKKMEIITEALIDARFLSSELLTLGRKKPLAFRTIHTQQFLAGIGAQYKDFGNGAYTIVLKAPDEPLYIQAEPDYLKRVFQNLLGNARDAMPNGGKITIGCKAKRHKNKPGIISISVADTGTGIPLEIRDKIFEPFFTTKKGKGTGLGLALVQRVVSLHQGTISVARSDSSGAEFLIELPEYDAGENGVITGERVFDRRTTTVLLLEDDPKIRKIMRVFLQSFDYTVLEASTSEEAEVLLVHNRATCQIVIMDWKLQNDDPEAVVPLLRAKNPDIGIIVVSGYPEPDNIERLNLHRWFTKPYDRNQLDMEIQKVLKNIMKIA